MSLKLMYQNKIIIYDMNRIIIENYKQILSYDDSNIIIDQINIVGMNLYIKEMNELYVEISGEIKEIKKYK